MPDLACSLVAVTSVAREPNQMKLFHRHSGNNFGQVTILDHVTQSKRILIRKQASKHIVTDTEWEVAPTTEASAEDLELDTQPIPPTSDLGDHFVILTF